MRVHLDFETRSEVDLRRTGAAIYAEDPTTDILCIVFAVEDDPPILIRFEDFQRLNNGGDLTPDLKYLHALAADEDVIFMAHNAAFEQYIWEAIMVGSYGFPEIPISRWRCTLAKAYSHGLPGSLEDAGAVMRLAIQKDTTGKNAMLKLCKPRRKKAEA